MRQTSRSMMLVFTAIGLSFLAPFNEFAGAQAPIGSTGCGSGHGPDIIISDIQSIANFPSFEGIDAFGFGHTQCNIGDAELGWSAWTNDHPVFGANLFRIRNGRFEQLGLSWLVHGFVALSNNVCSCGCIPTNGTTFGIGCSDSNSAFIQALASVNGPRSEVNAHTGNFLFPHGDGIPIPNGYGIFKRLQVSVSDLDPAQNGGGSYYVEMFTIAPGDALAGNGANNASYRKVAASQTNGEWQLAFAAQPVRGYPAIYAWQLEDPQVVIRQVPVPGDGLFLAGAKATYVGEGFWEYEYAIENLNVERAARAVLVDIPSDVVVQNVGFHDVDYHSGEPFDSTDWTALFNDAETYLRWYTTPFEVNPNANALRWSTTYNFRFQANRAPVPGSVTIDLFKPGTPASVVAELIVPNPVRPDCNLNNIDDACDLTCLIDGSLCDVADCGQSGDVNSNGLPDECESLGDSNNDGDVDLLDFAVLTDCLNGPGLPAPSDECTVFDIAADDDVDLHDFAPVMNSFAP